MKTCVHCGAPLSGRSRRFCSRSCNNTYYRDSSTQACERPQCERPVRARGLCVTHYNATYHKGSQRKFDDPEKRRVLLRRRTQRRRALTRDPDADLIDRDEVGERDGWRCGICRRKVNRLLPYPHPRSPSLDHIVPLSLGGRHVRENVRISHLKCNMGRSNRSHGHEQLLLVG